MATTDQSLPINPIVLEDLKNGGKDNNFLRTLISFVLTSFDLIRSVAIRIVFGVHALVAICMVCYVRNDLWYLVNSVGIVFIMVEWFFIAMPNGGKDLPW
jgi:hypothetical protein